MHWCLLLFAFTAEFEPDPDKKGTRFWIDHFTNEDAGQTRVALNNARFYVPQFRRIFEEEGVPRNLVWIAWVETHFKPRAVSVSYARGIFQFKAETARAFGLVVNRKRDERNNPQKCARAAARYLLYLYERFPDWDLALAAYNLGEGDLRRAMQRRKVTTWPQIKPHVRRQTREYVDKVKAAVVLGNRFMNKPESRVSGKIYTVRKGDTLYELSKRLGVTAQALRNANNIRDNNIYPGEKLVIPGTRAEPSPDTGEQVIHTVVRGDTLSALSRRFGVSVETIKALNGLQSNLIHPGQSLRISNHLNYQVKRGDTLGSIAKQFGVSVRALAELNNLEGSRIYIGQNLLIPSG